MRCCWSMRLWRNRLALLAVISGSLNCGLSGPGQSTPQRASEGSPRVISGTVNTVSELIEMGPTPGDYQVDAYLVGAESCPPCPPGANCELCRDENLAISDDPTPVTGYVNPDPRYLILDPPDAKLEVGRRYRFVVHIFEQPASGDPPRVGRVVDARLIR